MKENDVATLLKKSDDILEAVKHQTEATKELTKIIGELNAAWEKWRKAGKF